jgi:hypothetical protein
VAITPVQRGSVTSAFANTGTTQTLTKPTGVVSGDLLVVYVLSGGTVEGTTAGTSIASGAGAAFVKAGAGQDLVGYGAGTAFTKVANGAEPASWTVTFNGTSMVALCVAVQTGTFDPTTPVPAAGVGYTSNSSSSATLTGATVTGVASGLLLNFYGSIGTSATAVTFTVGGSQTELGEINGGASGFAAAVLGDLPLAASGATTAQTATGSTSRRQVNVTLAVSPAPTAYTHNPADTAGATDTVTRSIGYQRTAADTADATDTVTAARGKSLTDTSAASDAVTMVAARSRTLADVAVTTDQVTAVWSHSEIQDFQFVLSEGPSDSTNPWVPFGLGQTIVVANFDPGSAEDRTQDVLSPVADIRYFGTDRKTPPTWAFDLYTDVQDAGEALGWAANFEALWDREDVRSTPGKVLPLRYAVAGRVRRVYGRPGNFATIPTYMRTGRVDIVADFRLAENTYYDDSQTILTIGLRPSTRTGLTFPLTFPLTFQTAGAPRQEQLTVGGTRSTWVDLTFYGEVQDPWVQIGNYRWGLRGTVADGQSIRMSGSPWQQGLLRSDGVWVPGMLDPRARLSALRLPPGEYTASMGGFGSTSNARVEVAWRNAYGSM